MSVGKRWASVGMGSLLLAVCCCGLVTAFTVASTGLWEASAVCTITAKV